MKTNKFRNPSLHHAPKTIVFCLIVALVLALLPGMVFAHDPDDRNAQAPTITAQPADVTVNLNDTVTLTVVATLGTKPGVLSYQWFSNTLDSQYGGTIIAGATNSTYSFKAATGGVFYFYCVVKNTDLSATRRKVSSTKTEAAKVTVNDPAKAVIPTITSQPADKTVIVNSVSTVALTVVATLGTAKGTLSYQWYSNTTRSTSGGTLIIGAINNSYDAPTVTVGTTYYFCIVKNTDTSVANPVATIATRVAEVKVKAAAPAATPAQIQQMTAIITAFDQAVANGQITGNSNGKSKNDGQKIDPFRNKLEGIKTKLTNGEITAAINNLNMVYAFIDGQPSPKDQVVGTAAASIATLILNLINTLK